MRHDGTPALARYGGEEFAAALFGRADTAMYEAKQRDRNRTVAAD